MERRELIQWMAATVGLRALQTLTPVDLLALGRDVHRRKSSGRTLSTHTGRVVSVAAERILPGATEANVAPFIDKMLADWHSPEERARFLTGLRDLDARCRAVKRRDFLACPEADQIVVLTALDDEIASSKTRDHWFATLKYLTVYGYCTSEIGMRELKLYPLPWRYDGCAPL